MEFWGVEIKVGKTVTVKPPVRMLLHISQAAIGEVKKDSGNESARLYLKYAGQKFVIGTLTHEKFPQLSLDLVLERECELSHNWKNGSIYLSGYCCEVHGRRTGDMFEPEDDGNIRVTDVEVKPNTTATQLTEKKQVNFVEAEKNESIDDDDEIDYSGDDADSSDDEMLEADGNANDKETSTDDDSDDSDDEDSDDSSKERVEKFRAEQIKKRSSDANVKTPTQKKPKLVSSPKTDGKKKVVHTATPHPAKQAGKPSTSSGQAKQAPKSSGSFSCKFCGRSFGSENALRSHSEAKHSSAA